VTEIDLLSKGRLRLGVGVGWNPVEFEGLGADFQTRGRRQEEQIELLRKLWQDDVVDFKGRFHRVDKAGINPLPGRRIPIWLGGVSEVAMQRAARLADGYMPLGLPQGEAAKEFVLRLRNYVEEAGRSFEDFGLETWTNVRTGDAAAWRQGLEQWREIGATHATLRLYGLQGDSPTRFLDAIRRYREAVID
jgi:probable F420-dependent oxidoreductase